MENPLDKWRKTVTPSPKENTPSLREYKAYEPQNKNECLEIRRVLGEWHAPSYRYLVDVAFNGNFGSQIALHYSFMVVKIRGKNLQPVIAALIQRRCSFIQDFHPNEFDRPEDTEPFIESIEIATSISGEDA